MSEDQALAALVSDLHRQVEQLPARGIKDAAGNPYKAAHFKRGLDEATARGPEAVAEYVKAYLRKAPGNGFKKLEAGDSLDLACETLVLDESKPYHHLFDDEERRLAAKRLAPHLAATDARQTATRARIDERAAALPDDLEELRRLAEDEEHPEDAVAINTAILERDPEDVVACIRLGRAHEGLGELEAAVAAFERAVEVAPGNAIAQRRLKEAARQLGRRQS